MVSRNYSYKAVPVTLALTLLSLSVVTSIAIGAPQYASAQDLQEGLGIGQGTLTNATMAGANNATNATMAGANNATNATNGGTTAGNNQTGGGPLDAIINPFRDLFGGGGGGQ